MEIMNFRKIAAVFAFAVAIIGNTVAAVLDLPANTPGLRHQHQNQNVNGVNTPCIHIIVPESQAEIRQNTDDGGFDAAINSDGNIYFPTNGVQPTTEEAVILSCANVDNTPTSPVTNWYMQMFGVLEHSGVFLEVGLDKTNTAKKILSIDGLLSDDLHNELPKKYISQKDAFVKNFRKIASTAVGRTLLYRILIEIRRHDSTVNKFGCVDSDVTAPIAIERRNDCRHLIINWKSSGNSFNFANKVINFGIQFPTRKPTTIGQENDLQQYHEIILYPRPDDVGLLHEMIHWYHFLRHTERFTIERNAGNGSINIHGKKADNAIYIHIGNYYWPTATEDRWKLSAMPWFVINEEELAVGFEEIRTILGSKKVDVEGYINGDDISENLYRSCDNQPLRFGHSGTAFYEDKSVIDKVKLACDNERHRYSTNLYNYIANHADPGDKPRFKYPSTVLKNGIGYFKIQQISVELIKP